jgi:two-component system, chemotaxis family, sensor kinase CheA
METLDLNENAPDMKTLNDVAAYLIQLSSDDVEGFGQLKNALHKICQGSTCHKHIAAKLEHVIEKIDAFLNAEDAHRDGLLEEINHLLDEALINMDTEKRSNGHLQNETLGKPSAPESADLDYMPADADLEMMGEFISESKDLIANAEEALLSLELDPDDTDAIGKVFRAFHTIKGTSAFLELSLLTNMAHHAENLLSRVREHEIRYSGGYADLSLRSLDMLKTLVFFVEEALNGAPLNKPPGYDDLLETLTDPESAGVSDVFDDEPSPRIGDILVAQGKVKREDLEDAVSKFGDVHVGEALVKSNMMTVKEVGQALRTQAKIKGGKIGAESTVRVSTQRLDKLIDMVGEMVIAQSMVAQDEVVTNGQNHILSKKISHTGKIVRELQDLSMSMRMVPLKPTFQKMARLVRDVARKVGKNVNLLTEGEDTEIDRNLVDIIGDPLVHMVRNAIDHGIESPEERIKMGKPSVGTVTLSAYHSAGNVVVEICDDGKGLNKDLILAKAFERNLVEKGRILTDREIYNLVFEPGFSTAQTVTDVSGRGVGMDVVKKNIDTLRGQVEINSEPGKGSVFKVFLPLTLAIIDGMVVRVGHESYVIPTETIVRSIKPEAKNISNIFNQGKVLTLQGNLIPLFRLSELFGIGCNKDGNGKQELVVVVEDDAGQAGIIIDELIGRQQVVIKSLGETLQGITGISGGAIMPDGRVGLIIDVGGLVKLAHSGIDNGHGTSFFEGMSISG